MRHDFHTISWHCKLPTALYLLVISWECFIDTDKQCLESLVLYWEHGERLREFSIALKYERCVAFTVKSVEREISMILPLSSDSPDSGLEGICGSCNSWRPVVHPVIVTLSLSVVRIHSQDQAAVTSPFSADCLQTECQREDECRQFVSFKRLCWALSVQSAFHYLFKSEFKLISTLESQSWPSCN